MLATKPYHHNVEEQSMSLDEFIDFAGKLASRLKHSGQELVRIELSWYKERVKLQTLTKDLEEVPPIVVDIPGPAKLPTDL